MTGQLDGKNRVTVSKAIRDELSLTEGEEIQVNVKKPDGGIGRNATLKLDNQKRVTIPASVRESLNIVSGDAVELYVGDPGASMDYWDIKTWNDFFSNLTLLSSSNNPVVELRNEVVEGWDGKNLSEVYPEHEEFFQPEKTEGAKIQKPWFLRFFDIHFFSHGQMISDYDGVVFRLEEGTGLKEVEIRVKESAVAPSTYFTETDTIDKVLEKARDAGFGIKEKEHERINLSSPEDVAEGITNFFQIILNSIVAHKCFPFILSLSHGTTENYARNCYKGFEDDLVFDKLEFIREPNFGLLKPGDYDTLSYKLNDVWSHLTDASSIEKVAQCLGIESAPDPRGDYLQRNFRSFKEGKFEKAENLLQRIRRKHNGLPYTAKPGKLAREIGISIGDFWRGISPLLFLGLLNYRGDEIRFSGLGEIEE